jgi:hypothetical protein
MQITITPENVYIGIACLLLILQVYQQYKLDKAKKEINKLWDQISTFNTMVALKLLENQKEIANLKENKDKDGK